MIVDTSAIVAILRGEPERAALRRVLEDAPRRSVSAATLVETFSVMDRGTQPTTARDVDAWLSEQDVQVAPFTERQARIAREAYRDFGRGSGHPARLNLGDCFAYALAKDTGEPLLFKGNDFGHTDVLSAL